MMGLLLGSSVAVVEFTGGASTTVPTGQDKSGWKKGFALRVGVDQMLELCELP